MRMDKLTSNFQKALADAQSLAVGRDNNIIEPVHVLSALLDALGPQSPHAFERIFQIAALLTLIPLLAVWRFDDSAVKVLATPPPKLEKHP